MPCFAFDRGRRTRSIDGAPSASMVQRAPPTSMGTRMTVTIPRSAGPRRPKSSVRVFGSHARPSTFSPPASGSRCPLRRATAHGRSSQSRNPWHRFCVQIAVGSVANTHQSVTDLCRRAVGVRRRRARTRRRERLAVTADAGQALGITQLTIGQAGQRAARNPFDLNAVGVEREFEHGRRVVVVDEDEPAGTDFRNARGVERCLAILSGRTTSDLTFFFRPKRRRERLADPVRHVISRSARRTAA